MKPDQDKIKLSVDLISILQIVDQAIKESEEETNKTIVIHCFQIGYLTGCKAILSLMLPYAASDEQTYHIIWDKIKQLKETGEILCKMVPKL